MDDSKLKISPPLYLAGMKINCWKCGKRMPVVALVAPNVEDADGEVCVLCDITELPKNVLEYVQGRVPTFKLKFSKTVNDKYYANTCPSCGVITGDFYIHNEPGAPFFPESEDDAKSLYITEIPITKNIYVESGCHMGTGDMIVEYARKIA